MDADSNLNDDFSFITPRDVSQTGSRDISTRVALPNDVPRPPDFSSLPPSILHSGTVETLIAINDDLMARLKINIRRNSVLEGQILELEKIQDEITHQNHSLVQQLEVVQEKGVRTDQLSQRVVKLEGERRALVAQVRSGLNYRRRVGKWVAPTIKRLKQELGHERVNTQRLQAQLENREAQLSDTRARMHEAVTHIQNQDKIFSKDQAKIVEQYESRQKQLEKEIERMTGEMKIFKDKASRMDAAVSAKADSQNHVISLERRNQELESRLHHDIAKVQSETTTYRQEAKRLTIDNLEIHRKLNEKMNLLETQTQSLERLQDQFESLQSLYLDAQRQLEGSRMAQENLNRLNHELTRQLKSQLTPQQVIDVEPVTRNVGPSSAMDL